MPDLPPIKYVIVLMLENRSFDHVLGYLRSADYPIDGLKDTESNEDSTGEPVPVNRNARYSGDFDPDPGHDFDDVTIQLYGRPDPAADQQPDMSGFVLDYEKRCHGDVADGHRIMRCFDRGMLPAITTLATNFAVCDRWFASVPGPTLPNRLFSHCGTSGGRLDMAPEYFFSKFKTIYPILAKANQDATIYADGWSGMATVSSLMAEESEYFAGLDETDTGFFTGCKRSRLSNYCFLEPRYSSRAGDDGILPQNDQHPDSDMREGDNLIRRVYEAIRKSDDIWKHCVFIITWDEHGGLYDHVVPPAAIPPGDAASIVPAFDFSRYGVRVPAVVVSPYIKAGTINSNTFDHTSLLATAAELLMNRKLLPAELGARAAAANSVSSCFDANLVANGPRIDTVKIPDAMAPPAPSPQPLNDLQKEHLEQAIALNGVLPAGARIADPGDITNDVEADAYIAAVFQAARDNKITLPASGGAGR